ncbi:hypothetical protein V1477_010040 [Vespula maculifrons]|uniref:Uncharacterized protein n=1 Tax=Vespula maculifrons TaxID=7453 RepID=A0ABD2CBH2_VESMC
MQGQGLRHLDFYCLTLSFRLKTKYILELCTNVYDSVNDRLRKGKKKKKKKEKEMERKKEEVEEQEEDVRKVLMSYHEEDTTRRQVIKRSMGLSRAEGTLLFLEK